MRSPWRDGRVALVYAEFPSSIQYATARPALLFRDRGMEVHLVTGAAEPQVEREGLIVWREPSLQSMAARLVHLRAEVVYLESPSRNLVLAPLARRSWVRSPFLSEHPLRHAFGRRLLAGVDAVSITNPGDAHALALRPAQIADLAYPVDVAFWAEPVARDPEWWMRRGSRAPTGPVVSYVSNLLRRKRQVELVEAMVPLLQQRPDLTLALAGRVFEPEVPAAIEQLRSKHHLGDQVVLLGEVDHRDARQLYAWTAVHAVNTAFETQCMAVYESLAARVPTIVSRIPSLTSAFPDLLAHESAAELRAHVECLLERPEVGRAQVERSMAQVEWADIKRHDVVFEEVCERLLR